MVRSKGRFVSFFVSRLDPEVEVTQLQDYVKNQFNVEFNCEKLRTRYDSYSSFKIEGYCKDPKMFYDSSKWPENFLVKKFYKPLS